MALVERGLKVEIRNLPPTSPEGAEDPEAAISPEFEELNKTIAQLVFPKVLGSPVLDLPPPEPPPEPAENAEAIPGAPAKSKRSKT